jgi:hypothetical protein
VLAISSDAAVFVCFIGKLFLKKQIEQVATFFLRRLWRDEVNQGFPALLGLENVYFSHAERINRASGETIVDGRACRAARQSDAAGRVLARLLKTFHTGGALIKLRRHQPFIS